MEYFWIHLIYSLVILTMIGLFTIRLKELSTMLSESHKERSINCDKFNSSLDSAFEREKKLSELTYRLNERINELIIEKNELKDVVKRQDKFINSVCKSWNKNLTGANRQGR